MSKLFVVLGNQLFPLSYLENHHDATFLIAEDRELCTYHPFHKHRLIFYLSAMRHYAQTLRDADLDVRYLDLSDERSLIEKLEATVKDIGAQQLFTFEIEDKFLETRVMSAANRLEIELEILPSPMFLTSRRQFSEYLEDHKPFMKRFYEGVRRRDGWLMDEHGKPVGGKYSFDADNRKKLPKKEIPPPLQPAEPDDVTREVMALVDDLFPDHPGEAKDFWLPVTRETSLKWLETFIARRLYKFGDYQDAITPDSDFVYHSVISPMINVGLLLPGEVTELVVAAKMRNEAPLSGVEGFVRQVIGWREFIRGIYQHFSERQETTNFFEHQRGLANCWWRGDTGLPPLDDAIRKAIKWGYSHHIERLMVIGNLMVLCEIQPKAAHDWFMALFVDSSDWVMGPNVYGMALFSDGGIFATKPYISGSNYIRKMSHYDKGEWSEIWDGLYWRFMHKHRSFFERNPRMKAVTSHLDRMSEEKMTRLFGKAENFIQRVTT